MNSEHVDFDEKTAALIAKGMMAVAKADGDIHPREIALIQAFQADVPISDLDEDAVLEPGSGATYLNSLVLVALADGHITPEEHTIINELAQKHGLSSDDVETSINWAKSYFLEAFSGVEIFKDSVTEIAESLNSGAAKS